MGPGYRARDAQTLQQRDGGPSLLLRPQEAWQRRTNENTNGLLRQYFPSGLALSTYSQHDLDVIALRLNSRPRTTLGFLSPRARITGAVAATRRTHCGLLRERDHVRFAFVEAAKAQLPV